MKFKKLIEFITEELNGAETYAISYKMSDMPEDKEMYKALASQELVHVDKLRDNLMKHSKTSDNKDEITIAKFVYSTATERAEHIKSMLRD